MDRSTIYKSEAWLVCCIGDIDVRRFFVMTTMTAKTRAREQGSLASLAVDQCLKSYQEKTMIAYVVRQMRFCCSI